MSESSEGVGRSRLSREKILNAVNAGIQVRLVVEVDAFLPLVAVASQIDHHLARNLSS
jgi:hypothetical protein